MARNHKAGGQGEPHAARMGELLPSRHHQQGIPGTRQLHSDAVAPVVAVQAQNQASQGRDLSTLASLRALWARTLEPAWARRAVGEGVKFCPRAGCLSRARPCVGSGLTIRPRTFGDRHDDFFAKDFKFHTGEAMGELKLHYTTVGEPTGQPVLVLHGSGGSAASMLTPAFAGELFGPGQPLDASKYYVIIPDGIGHGKSSKPSDGMKTAFPKYNYEDMVDAQYRLVKEGLGIKHLRLVIGNSMGGMHTWIWGVRYPQFMDALVPMASQPTEMAARNWMLRRAMLETIRNDPDYNGGNYTSQPRMMKYAITAYGIASIGGTLAYQQQAPTAAKADKIV